MAEAVDVEVEDLGGREEGQGVRGQDVDRMERQQAAGDHEHT